MVNFQCCQCLFSTQYFLKLLQHYRYMHKGPNSRIVCNVQGCHRTFQSVRSFQRHVSKKHSDFWAQYGIHRHMGNQDVNDEDDIHEPEAEVFENDNGYDNAGHQHNEIDPNNQVVTFLIGLREQFKIPHSACSFVSSEVNNLLDLSHSQLQSRVQTALQNAHIDPAVVNISEAFSDRSWQNAFDYYSDVRRVNEFCAEQFDFVEPVEYVFGRAPSGKIRSMQYISILSSLTALLKKDEVLAEVLNGHSSADESISDYCDGSHCKKNVFLSNQLTLKIQLYNDDFCVANPLGNKVKTMKFCAFYFLLGNLTPKFRSKLNMIQLACLCPTEYVKEYGLQQVLAPLLLDLRILENEGVIIEKDGVQHTFTGTLSMVVADNLAAHSIGGFQESFNTLRTCRFCLVTKPEMKNHLRASPDLRRTEASYNQQARIATDNPDMAGIYGIKTCSVLNSVSHFHVINGLPSDIAHDLFEGVVPNVVEKVILHCVQEGYFTLEELNTKIECFPYTGSDLTNKPSKMKTDNNFKVKQTAIQCWCLLRLLPLLVGSEVPVGDKVWELLLQLADVVEYATTQRVTRVFCHFFADIIEAFLESFIDLFPDASMTPKFHFLTHYPQQMLDFGPLIHCWTLRFEGKHMYFKELSYRTKNKRNTCKTLAFRHEYFQSWCRTKERYISDGHLEHSGGGSSLLRLMLKAVQDLLIPLSGGADYVYTVKNIDFSGTKYWQGCVVVVGKSSEGLLRFAIVELICLIGGLVYFVCRCTSRVEYFRHLHCHSLAVNDRFFLVTPTELTDYYPLSAYQASDGRLLVVIRHHIS